MLTDPEAKSKFRSVSMFFHLKVCEEKMFCLQICRYFFPTSRSVRKKCFAYRFLGQINSDLQVFFSTLRSVSKKYFAYRSVGKKMTSRSVRTKYFAYRSVGMLSFLKICRWKNCLQIRWSKKSLDL